MNSVVVNRPGPAAFGANAAPDSLNLAFHHFGRDVFGDAQDRGVLVAFVVAETLLMVARPHATHHDG
jgi:hypothetical protein